MSDTSDDRHRDRREAFEREESLDAETIAEDAVELFEQPASSPVADSDVPPPG